MFGPVAAWDASGLSVLPKMRKSRAVLAVLALRAPLPISRGQLTALLWSRRDPEQARASLRQSVHELQEALGAGARALLQADRTHLRLRAEGLWVDAGALHAGALPLAEAAALYRPTLLEDLLGLDPAFDRWVEAER
ncbi:MAG: helix-turn-helix domain-containing protein, partial [Acetobacteraceae bacterium]|nr:helix-turn-helix domain-containing protein [Acetobacteraceae bacterium]